MSQAPVQNLAASAGQCGISNSQAPSAVQSCPNAPAQGSGPPKGGKAASNYEYCNLQQLKVDIVGDKTASMQVTSQRRWEPPLPTVADDYKMAVQQYDLVIETLASVQETTATWGKGEAQTGKGVAVTVTASNGPKHASFSPAHPHTAISGGPTYVETHGGAPAKVTLYAPDTSGMSRTTWALVWPFGDDRVANYTVSAAACGVLPAPQKTTSSLAMRLVVLPHEQWKIAIGISGTRAASWSKERDIAAARGGPGGDKVATTTVVKKRVGDTETTEKLEKFGDKKSHKKKTETERKVTTNLLGAQAHEEGESKQYWGKNKSWQDTPDKDAQEYRKVNITRIVAGRQVDTDVQKTINKILLIKDMFDKAKNIFDSVKLGWSISASYELFAGSLDIAWGYRWPLAGYKEDGRVYYVERFISVGGTCTLLQGKVEGMFGIEIDPWYAPVTFVAKVYVAAALKVDVNANLELAYTNPNTDKRVEAPFGGSGTCTLELGAKIGGRAAGYSLDARLALEGGATLKVDCRASFREGLVVKGTLIVGLESKLADGTLRYDAVRLVGEVITVGDTTDRYAFDPIEVIKGKKVFKDEVLLGPKS